MSLCKLKIQFLHLNFKYSFINYYFFKFFINVDDFVLNNHQDSILLLHIKIYNLKQVLLNI